MTWLRVDDNMMEHPKIIGLSNDAFRLHLRGLAYCSRQLTDGHVPEAIVGSLMSHLENPQVDGTKTMAELNEKKLWRRTRTGYTIANFKEWNPTRQEVEAKRRAKSEAGKRGAEARWGDSSSHSNRNGNRHGTSYPTRNAPIPSPKSYEVNQEGLGEEAEHNTADAIHRLLDTCGQERGQHAHLELMSMMAQGATAWDFDTARSATLKARPKHPWNYAKVALRNRLANKEPAA